MSDDNAITPVGNGTVIFGKFTLTKTGLLAHGSPTFTEWEYCGNFLKQTDKAVQFWIGDWLNYGESKYGETYTQALEATDYENKTLRNGKWVASRVELSRRRDNLSFSHHEEVASLEPSEQDYWLDRAESESWTRNDLRHNLKLARFQKEIPTLPTSGYRVIYADPPWEYGFSQHSREEQETTLDSHYPSMTLEQICALPVADMAQENAVLFLWATSPLLPQAFEVIKAWGFAYKSSFVWDKVKHNVGYYNSVRHELLLIATKGSCLPDKKPEGEPVLIDSVQSIERREHSRKPEEFRAIIDNLYPSGTRIELFAREIHPGWETWGNEV